MEIKNKFNIGDTVYVLYYGHIYERKIQSIIVNEDEFLYKLYIPVGDKDHATTCLLNELHLFETEEKASERLESSLQGNLQCFVDYINKKQPSFKDKENGIPSIQGVSSTCKALNKKFKIVIIDNDEEDVEKK